MKPVIVGTAGHIDHGKTALVKALTGIDADRWAEEKRRGITIDIGFAHLELAAPDGTPLRIGFVDVPGHERFVRNMLAGIGGIDLVLLIISADEGVKPQTREHFDICRMLNIRRGITVLTKADLVDPDTLAVVRMEVEEFVRGSFLEGAPIVPVSAIRGDGLEVLKRTIAAVAADVPSKNADANFRLPIDRVFTMKGFGTVVTGTLLSGAVHKDEELEVFPTGQRVRVRGVQVHGHTAETARAGERTALNLAGASTEDLARGMALTHPALFHETSRADVQLTLLKSARPLKDRSRVHLHVHTAEVIAEVVLHALSDAEGRLTRPKEVKPGETVFAQLRTAEPLLLLPGDRFIVRQFSPVVTIGGGVVIDGAPLKRAKAQDIAATLNSLASGDPECIVAARIDRRGAAGLSIAEAIAETGWTRNKVEAAVCGDILKVGDLLVGRSAFERAQGNTVDSLNAFHNANPLAAAMPREQLREQLEVPPEVFQTLLDALAREKKINVSADAVHLAGRGVEMNEAEARSKREIEAVFAAAGLKVPYLKDVLASLRIGKDAASKIVTLLLREKVLVKVSDELVFHASALQQLRNQVVEHKTKSAQIDVATFKDLTGVSRKYAIPLLEYLDRERVTRRAGDARMIL